jgi:hypothetical protein
MKLREPPRDFARYDSSTANRETQHVLSKKENAC